MVDEMVVDVMRWLDGMMRWDDEMVDDGWWMRDNFNIS